MFRRAAALRLREAAGGRIAQSRLSFGSQVDCICDQSSAYRSILRSLASSEHAGSELLPLVGRQALAIADVGPEQGVPVEVVGFACGPLFHVVTWTDDEANA